MKVASRLHGLWKEVRAMMKSDEHYAAALSFVGAWQPPSFVAQLPPVPLKVTCATMGIDPIKVTSEPLSKAARLVSSFSLRVTTTR